MTRIRTGQRCTAFRRDGLRCYATATWGRLHCPRHDPAVEWRPTGYPPHVRERALTLYREHGPAEAASRLADDLQVWLGLEDLAKARPHKRLVVSDQDPDAHAGSRATTRKPPPLRRPLSSVPP